VILDELVRARPAAPVLVGGDFNATWDNEQFRDLLTDGFHDAAAQAGAGIVRTYPSNAWHPPVIGIDHVLTRHAVATSLHTVRLERSDHLAVVARVSVP
jgi:endonuclease/exonuclease/phosphatase (EEP) superfamily protein YafD